MTGRANLDDKLACVRRGTKMRERVYPRWVAMSKMSNQLADHKLAGMRAVSDTLAAMLPAEQQQTLPL